MTEKITKPLLLICFLVLISACSVGAPAVPPTPTPVPTVADLLKQLESAGLEVAKVDTTLSTSGPLEGVVEQGKFYTPSLCDGCSSIVFVFESEASALTAVGVFDQAAKASDAFKFHIYRNGRVLLRMGGLIDKAQADRYGQALNLKG